MLFWCLFIRQERRWGLENNNLIIEAALASVPFGNREKMIFYWHRKINIIHGLFIHFFFSSRSNILQRGEFSMPQNGKRITQPWTLNRNEIYIFSFLLVTENYITREPNTSKHPSLYANHWYPKSNYDEVERNSKIWSIILTTNS